MKKVAYISLNMAELEALMTRASFAEITMYLILKKLANFKNGQVGGFRQQKLNYQKLADLVSRPPRNTAPAETYDRNQARAMVLRLEKIGMLSQISYENEALKMRLHLSPMGDYEEDKALEATPALGEQEKSHQAKERKSLESPVVVDDDDHDPFAISTDFLQYKQYSQSSHTDSTGNSDKGEEPSPSVAVTGNIHPFPSSKNADAMSAGLTSEQVFEKLRTEGFRLLDHPVSQSIVNGWLKSGLQELDLNVSVFKLVTEGGDLVPGELDKEFRSLQQMRKGLKVNRTGRGSVAL